MFEKISMKLMRLGLASMFALGLFGFAVNNASATFINITDNIDGSLLGTLEGSGDFVGYLCSSVVCETNDGTLFGNFNVSTSDFEESTGPNSGDPGEATAVRFNPNDTTREEEVGQQITQDPTLEFFSKDETPNAGDIDITEVYFSLKIGTDTAYFRNTSGGTLLDLIYTQLGTGAGLSHVTQYIPLPASLPLFGAGLALLGLMGLRRRRKASGAA